MHESPAIVDGMEIGQDTRGFAVIVASGQGRVVIATMDAPPPIHTVGSLDSALDRIEIDLVTAITLVEMLIGLIAGQINDDTVPERRKAIARRMFQDLMDFLRGVIAQLDH